jgi:AcrR family transcriptional regulator
MAAETGGASTGKRGRPRDPHLDGAVLAAAADILASDGYPGLRMAELARAAGTTKTAIYRRWPSRTAVLLDVLAERLPEPEAFPEAPDQAGSMRYTASRLAEAFADPVVRNGLTALIADGAVHPEVAAEFRRRIIEPQLAAAAAALDAAQAEGTAPAWLTSELLADVMAGTVLQRTIVRGAAADESFFAELATFLLAALRP